MDTVLIASKCGERFGVAEELGANGGDRRVPPRIEGRDAQRVCEQLGHQRGAADPAPGCGVLHVLGKVAVDRAGVEHHARVGEVERLERWLFNPSDRSDELNRLDLGATSTTERAERNHNHRSRDWTKN